MTTSLKQNNGLPAENFFDKPQLKGTFPPINIRNAKNNYELQLALPGYKKKDLKIDTENGLLGISASTSHQHSGDDESYNRKEFSCVSFSRAFILPDNVSAEHIKASYHHGLLTITLKKSDKKHVPVKKEVKIA